MRLHRGFLAAAVLAVSGFAGAAEPTWISTTADHPWVTEASPRVNSEAVAKPDLVVHTQQVLQQIDGFGGCFNELGWQALLTLPEDGRTTVLRSLFADDGCGFTLGRLPIGASDYAREWYSLDDTPGDLDLAHFSIDRDRGYLLRYVKSAMAIRPELNLWVSAWSPPAWMKDNGRYNSGHLKGDAPIQSAYAAYLARAVQAFQDDGLHVYAAMVQNEPKSDSKYPTCTWTGEQERDFIAHHMGPTFRDRHVDAELWLGTINDGHIDRYAVPVLTDPVAASFVAGVAYQWEGRDAIAETHRRFPKVKLMQSESECGTGANSFADAEHTFSLVRRYLNGGASSYFFWNMVLPPGGVSTWGWKQNAMITVDPANGQVTYHPEFQLMRHLSGFVRTGAHLTTTTGAWGDKLAFVRPDGAAVVLVGNSAATDLPVAIAIDDGAVTSRTLRVTLHSHSFNTFIVPPKQ